MAPSWFVPPVVAVVAYALPAFDVAGCRSLAAFASNTTTANALYAIRMGAVAVYCGLAAALCGAAFVVALARLAGAGPADVGVSALGFGVAAVCAVLIVSQGYGSVWQAASRGDWSCSAVGSQGSRVCLPREQRRHLDAMAQALAQFDDRVLTVSPRDGGWLYEPRVGFVDEGAEPAITVDLPAGPSIPSPDALAETIAGALVWCAPGIEVADSDLDLFGRAQATVTLWLDPGATDVYFALVGEYPNHGPDAGEASAALAATDAACGD
jgi:hypothetical protein